MTIKHLRNPFYFDHESMRLFASAMDFRPYLQPTGWVLSIRGEEGWEMAEYGIAYSPESAFLHAEEAKGRYIRKHVYAGRYQRELSLRERRELQTHVSREAWSIVTYVAIGTVDSSTATRSAPYRARVAALCIRDEERLLKLRRRQKRLSAVRRAT